MRVAVLSDTHVPSRASGIPAWVRDEIGTADHVVHAGDFDSPDAYRTVRDLADGDLTAVAGNLDSESLDLPDVATATLGGVTFVVTHGTGPSHNYGERVAETVVDAAGRDAVGIAGHTHEVLDETVDGVRLLNPGSATGAHPATRETLLVVEAADGALSVDLREG